MFDTETEIGLAVYCAATEQDREIAIQRLLHIGLLTWRTDPHYRGERTCGRVMREFHTSAAS